MAAANMPPIEFLRECFSYNPETGEFRWRHRPDTHFDAEHIARCWNSRMAGALAFQQVEKDGYLRCEVRFGSRRYRLKAHRVAFLLTHGHCPDLLDHRNRNPKDNRAENLRQSDPVRNSWNRNSWKDREGVPSGAYRSGSRWRSKIGHKGRKIELGTFDTPQEAHDAYAAFIYANRPDHASTGAPGPFG